MLIDGDVPASLQRNAFLPKQMQTKLKTIGSPAIKAVKTECERILIPGGANGQFTSAGSDLLEDWDPLVLDDPALMTRGPKPRCIINWLQKIRKWVEKHFGFFVGELATTTAMSDLDLQTNAFAAAQRDCVLPQLTLLILLVWLARTDMSSDNLVSGPQSLKDQIQESLASLSCCDVGDKKSGGDGGGAKDDQFEDTLALIGKKAVASELLECAKNFSRCGAGGINPTDRRRKHVFEKIPEVISHPAASELIGFVDDKGQVRFADPVALSTSTTPYAGFLPQSLHREVAKRRFNFSAISVEEAVRAVAVPIFAMFHAEEHDVPAFLRRVADHIDEMEPGTFRHMAVEDKWPLWSNETMTDDDRLAQMDKRIETMQKHLEELRKERDATAAFNI
jgi:hypothetical protein